MAPLPVKQHPLSQPAETSPAQAVVVPRSAGVTIMELREAMCRFPLGDPTTPEFRFCGTQASTGLPYCAHHAQIAYTPVAERKRLRA
jgi:GcrA cell cycle regulator